MLGSSFRVIVSLLIIYTAGALVLAHSLRDGGTKKKLGVLVTVDSVAAEAITQLKVSFLCCICSWGNVSNTTGRQTVYDYVIPVPRIKNNYPANLSLMNRADLASAFTKINLWKQTSFRKIVYIDADVIAYRAPDELFDLPHAFSAAPDIGWPDIFNSGVMVLTPSMGEYYALSALAERGISFDGADQGLLNMHFKNTFNRLSFTYNVTPSGHYQYVPAYRHFQSGINMVHFIGTEKPWFQGRHTSTGSGPYDEMIGRWWAVYDRHYRVEVCHVHLHAHCVEHELISPASHQKARRRRVRNWYSILPRVNIGRRSNGFPTPIMWSELVSLETDNLTNKRGPTIPRMSTVSTILGNAASIESNIILRSTEKLKKGLLSKPKSHFLAHLHLVAPLRGHQLRLV